MKNKVFASIIVTLLLLCLVQVTLNFAPMVLSEPGPGRRDFWQVVNMTNSNAWDTSIDVNVTVNSRNGVNIACSNNVTGYFANSTNWQGPSPPYPTYWDWLNGTSTQMYHWGEMKWYVSSGSLTSISYSDIQFWGPMYFDSGGGVNYTTFRGNTFMADWNLSASYNDPDIVYQAPWQGNQIKMISGLKVPNNTQISIVFDIVITEPGAFTFNVSTTGGVSSVAPTTWTIGGASTVLVPIDYAKIQDAVNAASPGDTIIVSSGTYNEALQIDKPLTVLGNGSTTTFIDGTGVALASAGLVKITANSGNVRFSGFTVKNAGAVGGVRFGIFTQSSLAGPTYTISNNTIYGTNNPSEADDYGFYAQGGKENIVFTRNLITETGANNIVFEQHTGSTEISYNTLDVGAYGTDSIFFMTYGGIDVTTLQNVSYNTFDMGTGAGFDYAHRATGISFCSVYPVLGTSPEAKFTNMVISGNTFNNLKSNRRGIGFWNAGTGDNLVSPLITNNTINGTAGSSANYGIDFYGLTNSTMIFNNTISGTEVGIYLRNGDAPGTRIRYNNIAGNVVGVDWTLGAASVEASYNWWGSENGPNSTASQYLNSTGDMVSGSVAFEPWLTKPYPPLAPISVVYLTPQNTSLTAPALGTNFTVSVTMANVTMMYGFQFTLRWNSSLLSLTNPSTAMKFPAIWGINKQGTTYYNATTGNYTLWESATLPASPFNGTVTVASLIFRSTYDPPYPSNITCNLAFENVIISNTTSAPMLRLIYNGTYSCNSAKPQLVFTSSEYNATHVPTEFDASINVTNVVNLCSVDFMCTFDPTLLQVLYTDVSALGPIFSAPVDNSAGNFNVTIAGITPPGINGTITLVRIHFKVQQGFIWNTVTQTVNGTLGFTFHQLNTTSGLPIDHNAVNGTYVYRPVPGSVKYRDKVDIEDLLIVAWYFGTGPGGHPSYVDLNQDGYVDILDIILVAHNFTLS